MIFSPPQEPKFNKPVNEGGIKTESEQVVHEHIVVGGGVGTTPSFVLKNNAVVQELLLTVIFT